MNPHSQVTHPKALLEAERCAKNRISRLSDDAITWICDHVLGSSLMFWLALCVPIALWNAPTNTKLLLALISGSWIQWWALHGLAKMQKVSDKQSNAKADVDHVALTHIANVVDAIKENQG